MLGIFLIICLIIYLFIAIKRYSLLKDNSDEYVKIDESVEIDSSCRTYNVCSRAVVLHVISYIIILLGYMGCVWPYLFIEGIDRSDYLGGIAIFGLFPALFIAIVCYLTFRNARGYIKISTEEIEYKRRKDFAIKVSEIKKIVYLCGYSFKIYLKEKGKRPLHINLDGFYKKKEIFSLMKQLRGYSAKISGRDKSLAHKFRTCRLRMFLGKYYFALYNIIIVLVLLYTSYCCIDYDFFKKDHTARFNSLGSDPTQSENAWTHYVQSAVNYTELEEDFQEIIEDGLGSGQLDLTNDQEDDLSKWFNENASSWASLKKAVSINYCNATYENISLMDNTDRDDFSSPSDTDYSQIKHFYNNVNACRLSGVIDLDWFDLFQMQLTSSKHFVNGKSFIDQLVGYAMLRRSIDLLAEQDNYNLKDLEKVRIMLKEHFPVGISSLSVEGEILIVCSTYDSMINRTIKIPVQSPLNPMFLMFGSSTGTEAYVRKRYTAILEQAHKGIEVEPEKFSIMNFPVMRHVVFGILLDTISDIYKLSQRSATNLLAAYFLLDLEEYQLTKGCYPEDISQLRQVGLTFPLPDDPDTDGKIIFRNDGQRAILYAVGKNTKDDGGYKDNRGSGNKRADIIYWQRNLKE